MPVDIFAMMTEITFMQDPIFRSLSEQSPSIVKIKPFRPLISNATIMWKEVVLLVCQYYHSDILTDQTALQLKTSLPSSIIRY